MANLAEFLDKLPILLVGFLMLATMTLTATAGDGGDGGDASNGDATNGSASSSASNGA